LEKRYDFFITQIHEIPSIRLFFDDILISIILSESRACERLQKIIVKFAE